MPRLVQELPAGPLAILGDIHGEIDALDALLGRLAKLPEPRGLVFVGDLVDRGPDSLAVLRRVRGLVERGLARVVAGNHELNLLQRDRKQGNGWFFGDSEDFAHVDGVGKVRFESRLLRPDQQAEVLDFCGSMPLMLQREDLRVVHACDAEASLAALPEYGDIAALDGAFAEKIYEDLAQRGVPDRAQAERARFSGLRVREDRPDVHLHNVAEEDAAHQNRNPVKVLTSGAEHELAPGKHFYIGGKWRFVTRDRWWARRGAEVPTVVGHYWRRRGAPIPGKLDVWDDVPSFSWCNRVFCVDYSVGRRYAERARGRSAGFDGGLAALLWPEAKLIWDDSDALTPTEGLVRRAPLH